jgi:hypothetical protein
LGTPKREVSILGKASDLLYPLQDRLNPLSGFSPCRMITTRNGILSGKDWAKEEKNETVITQQAIRNLKNLNFIL